MEEMIDAQPGLVGPILAAPQVAAVAELVRAAAGAGEPVVLTGCGTSEHAAMAGAALLREAGVSGARARDAFEAGLDPQRDGVLIAVSHEAGTAATLAAGEAAAARDARLVLVTALPDRAPGWALALATPLRDTSWCHTVGYLSPLLALYAVAARVAGAEPDAAAAEAAVTGTLARRPELRAAAARLAGCERLLVVASGVDEVTARELALKVEEGVHVPVTPLGVEKVLHGHLPAADARTGLVLLRADQRRAERRNRRAEQVAAAAAELEMPTVRVDAPRVAGLPPVASALLTGAVAAQLLTLELVLAAGTNPDLIRREEPRYRAAAAAAGT